MLASELWGASNPAGDLEAELDQLFAMTELEAKSSVSSCTSLHCYTFVARPGLT